MHRPCCEGQCKPAQSECTFVLKLLMSQQQPRVFVRQLRPLLTSQTYITTAGLHLTGASPLTNTTQSQPQRTWTSVCIVTTRQPQYAASEPAPPHSPHVYPPDAWGALQPVRHISLCCPGSKGTHTDNLQHMMNMLLWRCRLLTCTVMSCGVRSTPKSAGVSVAIGAFLARIRAGSVMKLSTSQGTFTRKGARECKA